MIVGFTLIIGWLKGMHNGLSVLLGGLSYWLPTLLFMWRISLHAGARAVKGFIVTFMLGEAFKLVCSGILFLLFIKYLSANIVFALLGLCAGIVAFWIASFSLMSKASPSS